jgi:hypothetical protein
MIADKMLDMLYLNMVNCCSFGLQRAAGRFVFLGPGVLDLGVFGLDPIGTIARRGCCVLIASATKQAVRIFSARTTRVRPCLLGRGALDSPSRTVSRSSALAHAPLITRQVGIP